VGKKVKKSCWFFLNSSTFNKFCIEALQMLCSWLRISSSFYPLVSLAYLDYI